MTVVAERKEVGMQDHGAPWTEEEFFALGETVARVELFDGSLLVSPSPNYNHQDLMLELTVVLKAAARAVGLWAYCDVDVRLQPGRVVEPDLIIRSRVPKTTTVTEGREVLLVCEITSTNAATDRVLKMHYYPEALPAGWRQVCPRAGGEAGGTAAAHRPGRGGDRPGSSGCIAAGSGSVAGEDRAE